MVDEICKNKVEPPITSRGVIALTYKYMKVHIQVITWVINKENYWLHGINAPVNDWEPNRSKRIETIQGNENKFVKDDYIS